MVDPYVYPETGVLRNLLGLKDADTLADHEAQASTLRLVQLAALRLEGTYDLPHLQEFHRFIFQDVYPSTLRSTVSGATTSRCAT